MSQNNDNKDPKATGQGQDPNLAEEVLRQAGKSEEEVKRTGTLDRADDQTEGLFEAKHRTVNSPIHKAVWEKTCPTELFKSPLPSAADPTAEVQKRCLEVVHRHRAAGTLYDNDPASPSYQKVTDQVLVELGRAGYWGMLVDKEFGGQAASVRSFMTFLTQMAATGDPTVAGWASIHGCIGAVDPVRTFGSPEQKKRFLPKLASGESTSGFALTEPNAGSDLTALRTTFTLAGDHYLVNGEKLFISNAIEGRTIGLVGLLEGKPAVLIVELPAKQDESWQVINYGLHALNHVYNNGLLFKNFRVPKENLLKIEAGDGLTIAYHGLNRGRTAVAANAAGVMRLLLRSITPDSWGKFRKTYGECIEKRELVKARIARLAGLIVGTDALVAWCSSLLDAGYRGELECIIAKVQGSEWQADAAIALAMKTHGGRSVLKGHLIGDNLHDYLAPTIYEGEGDMLAMALFKTLAKEHGMGFMLPMGNSMADMLKKHKVSGLFGLMYHGVRYTLWQLKARLPWLNSSAAGVDKRLARHVSFAQKMFGNLPLELSGAMVKHQLKLADRQCRINYMSRRVMDTVTMIVTALYASQVGDEATIAAADVLCQQLRMKLTGEQPTDEHFKACSKLADMVVEGRFTQLTGVPETDIIRTYGEK